MKNGSLRLSISVLDAFLIVNVLDNRPIAHTDMHLTAGSSTCFCFYYFEGPDLRKILIRGSRHYYASGIPMPPIAAAITSLT